MQHSRNIEENIHFFWKQACNQQKCSDDDDDDKEKKYNFIFVPYRSVGINSNIARFKEHQKKKIPVSLSLSSLHNFKWFDVRHSHFSKPFLWFYSSFRLMFICFFFHLRTNLSVCKVLCGCAIILTRVILFSSIYVNVDILSAFHVSTSTPIVVAVAIVMYVCFFFFSPHFQLYACLDSPLPFVIMRRFHLQKLIQQTEQKTLFYSINTQTSTKWNGN